MGAERLCRSSWRSCWSARRIRPPAAGGSADRLGGSAHRLAELRQPVRQLCPPAPLSAARRRPALPAGSAVLPANSPTRSAGLVALPVRSEDPPVDGRRLCRPARRLRPPARRLRQPVYRLCPPAWRLLCPLARRLRRPAKRLCPPARSLRRRAAGISVGRLSGSASRLGGSVHANSDAPPARSTALPAVWSTRAQPSLAAPPTGRLGGSAGRRRAAPPGSSASRVLGTGFTPLARARAPRRATARARTSARARWRACGSAPVPARRRAHGLGVIEGARGLERTSAGGPPNPSY